MDALTGDVGIEALLPHKAPVRAILGVTEVDGAATVCEARVEPDSSLVRDGVCPALCGLEILAQASAVHAGLRSPGDAGAGFLLRARSVDLHVDELPLGRRMTARVERTDDGDGPMGAFRGTLSVDGGVLVTAQFLVRRSRA